MHFLGWKGTVLEYVEEPVVQEYGQEDSHPVRVNTQNTYFHYIFYCPKRFSLQKGPIASSQNIFLSSKYFNQ